MSTNRGYQYGKSSLTRIHSIRPIMMELCERALKIANTRKLYCPDISITDGLRTLEQQRELWRVGRQLMRIHDDATLRTSWMVVGETVTNCDGCEVKSPHQSGLAIDFCAWVDGKANYEPGNLALIATCFFEAGSDMGIDVDWGGSFRSISDVPHIEVKL